MKENEKVIYPLFSKVLSKAEVRFNDSNWKAIKKAVKDETYKNVSQATSMTENCHVLDNPNLKFLHKRLTFEIKAHCNMFLQHKDKFKITTSWFTKTKKDGYSDFHNHSNSMFSGVFYIQSNEETDKIAFSDFKTSTWLLEFKEQNIYNSQKLLIPTYPGLLLIFPADVFHRIEPNVQSGERISMAFNVVPTGTIGYNDSSLTLKCK